MNSAFRFGRYAQPIEDLEPGRVVVLDEYDGFFDQSLDGVEVGQVLTFVIWEGMRSRDRQSGIRAACTPVEAARLLSELLAAPLVTGAITTRGASEGYSLRIESVVPLGSLEEEAHPGTSDLMYAIDEYRESVRLLEGDARPRSGWLIAGSDALMTIGGPLGFTITALYGQDDVSLLWAGGPRTVNALFVGPNYLESCWYLQLRDLPAYRAALASVAESSASEREAMLFRDLTR